MAKKRVIKPRFYIPPPDPHKISGRELLKISREEKLVLTAEERARGLTIENLAAEMLESRRKYVFKSNTSSFFTTLCNEIIGPRISEKGRMPLFEETESAPSLGAVFSPDIIYNGRMRTTLVEVKATSNRNKRPLFGARQTAGYLISLLDNSGSEVLTGTFCYGGEDYEQLYKCTNKNGHKCDNRCLAEKLSHSVSDLLILPHNFWTLLLVLASPFELNQASSQSSLGGEIYRRPYKKWIQFLLGDSETPGQIVGDILEHAKGTLESSYRKGKSRRKKLWPKNLSADDFYLHDLEVKRYGSPPDLYCRSSRGIPIYKVWPFPVTEYKISHESYSNWVNNLGEKLDIFLDALWLHKEYDKIIERKKIREETQRERQAIKEEDKARICRKPYDDIPI